MIARRPSWLRLATAFAALALLVRMMVPAGFMPMVSAGGLPALMICPGQQPLPPSPTPGIMHGGHGEHGAAAHHTSDKSDVADHGGDHTCPFGALAVWADVAGEASIAPLPAVATTIMLVARLFLRPGVGLAAPPPPKTGPPALR